MNLNKNKILFSLTVSLTSIFLIACGSSDDHAAVDTQPTKNIVEIASDDGNLTTLVSALEAAGLDDDLAGPGQLLYLPQPMMHLNYCLQEQ